MAITLTQATCDSKNVTSFRLPLPSRVIFFALASILGICQAQAQNNIDLRFLIFDPVLIEPGISEDRSQISELTNLPSSGEALSSYEIIVSRLLNNIEQPIFDIENTILDYEKSIQELELQGGAYEPALGQELLGIANLYQSMGDHVTAINYLEQSLHINRVNNGLFNLEQEAILTEKIKSHIALGELYEADQQQEYLFYVKSKNYGNSSIELLPALQQYAEWNIFAYDSRLVRNPALNYSVQPNAFLGNDNSSALDLENFRFSRLLNAQVIYEKISQILLHNFGSSDQRLLDIEHKLALTNYFLSSYVNFNGSAFSNSSSSSVGYAPTQGFNDMTRVSSNSMGYRRGREALERRLSYMSQIENIDPQEIAKVQIDLADWLLIFKKRKQALEMYQQAYDDLLSTDIDENIIDSLFYPPLPQTLPTFLDYRYTRAANNISDTQMLDYKGWIDIYIRINRFGLPLNIEVLATSDENQATELVQSRLIRLLRNSTAFRPRISNGELLEEDTVNIRYYYSY